MSKPLRYTGKLVKVFLYVSGFEQTIKSQKREFGSQNWFWLIMNYKIKGSTYI